MAKKSDWRDYLDEEATGSSSSDWRSYVKDDAINTVGSNITNRVNTWLDNHNNYISNYQSRYADRKYNYEDFYVRDSASWLDTVSKQKSNFDAEADSILSYMDQYKDYLDADWMQSVRDTLTGARGTQSQIVDAATKDDAWWKSFKDEDDYKKHQRYDGYSKKYAGLTSEELYGLTGELRDGEEKDWLKSYAYTMDYDERSKLDITKASKEIEEMEDFYNKAFNVESWHTAYQMNPEAWEEGVVQRNITLYNELTERYGSLQDLDKLITKKKAYLNRAKHTQKGIKLSGVADEESEFYDPEFSKHNQYVADGKTPLIPDYKDIVYDYVNGSQDAKNARTMGVAWSRLSDPELARLDATQYMGDDEKAIYNYYYNKHGYDAAEEYLDSIVEVLDGRKAQENFKSLENHPLLEWAYGIPAGFDQANSGIRNLFNTDDYIPASATQQTSALVREDLGDVGFKLPKWMGGASIGQGVYDAITTTANMAPSIMVSTAVGMLNPTAGALVGNLTMGASAAGNAYQEAVNMGYDKGQARAYSTLIGASEVGLQYLMGGIGKLGGKLSGKAATTLASKFDNAYARLAVKYGMNMLSEGTEEYLQEILTPVFKNLALNTDEEVNLITEDAIYSFLLGAITSGFMEGTGISSDNGKSLIGNLVDMSSKNEANVKAATKYGDIEVQKALIQEGLASDVNSESHQLAETFDRKTKKGKSMTGYEIRQLVGANEAQFVVENYEEALPLAKKRLADLGETGNIDKIADLVAKRASGQKLTASEKSALVKSQYGAKVAKEMTPATADLNYKSLESRVGTKSNFAVSDSGKTVVRDTGEEIDIKKLDVATVGDGQLTFKVAEGREVSADGIDFADDNQSFLVSGISNIENITPAAATAMIHDIVDMEKPLSPQLNGLDEAFTYGNSGYSVADLKAGNFTTGLTNQQMMSAYKLGQSARANSKTNRVDSIKRMRTAVQAATEKAIAEGKEAPKAKGMSITYNYGGGKVVSIEEADIKTAKQEGGTALAKILLDMNLGTSVEFFSSKVVKDANGNRIRVFVDDNGVEQKAYSGVYRKSDGTIRIDLNAYNGRGLTLNALSHELTHFVQQWSPEKYEALADFLIKTYEKTDMSMNDRVLREQARLKGIRGEEVSYSEAYDEVIANAMAKMFDDGKLLEKLKELASVDKSLVEKILEGIKDFFNRFVAVYEKQSALFHDTADIMEIKENFEKLQSIFAEALVDASGNYRASLIAKEVGLDVIPVEDVSQYSYSSLAEAAGFEAVENDDGTRAFVREGKKVSRVTIEDIDNSPIGAFINFSLEMGDISDADAKRQKEMFANICTMACKTNDFAMTMQFVGSAVFTGMKANADKQYGTTYDFPSICTKTQAVIDAMSAKMMSLGRGLKTDEIVKLYDDVFASGNPVPCPECYVFSRWIGIGGLLDNIKKYQDYYGDMAVEDVAAEYRKMKAEVSKFAEEQGISFGKAKGALTSKLTKEFNKLTEKIEKAENQGEKVKPADRNRLAELEPMMNTVKGMTWLENVYFADSSLKKVNPNFRVPDSVLFDLNNGEAFATKYKEAWAFRTTQGAGYGKAITPYAEARLGEGILVTNNTTNAIKGRAQGSLNNYFLNQKGKLDKQSRDALKRARLKQKIQAFLGGQRFQSTSDARYENASDYLLAALEMQAMAGMVQCYTKVDGAVPAFSAWGFSINQSLMPLNGGLDADGNVKDTPVGGMKPSVAFENRNNHETAGTITIGVNDNHIRAMFELWNRDFIIPYHASGGKADVVAEFRRIQEGKEEKGEAVRSTDYSRTQGDKVLSDEVLRWQGKTDAQIQRIHEIRNARIAILTGGKPNMTVVRSNRFLSALYEKFNGGEWDGVRVAKSKVESQIFPNEFWDQTVTYDESAKITKDYLEYCEDLGFLHRFSGMIPSNGKLIPAKGYNENGERVQLTDLAYKYDENGNKTADVEDFFWKVLTDRRMYDNNGNYLAQKIVTLNDTTADTVTGFAKNNQGRQYDKAKAEALAQKILKGEQYSSQETDAHFDQKTFKNGQNANGVFVANVLIDLEDSNSKWWTGTYNHVIFSMSKTDDTEFTQFHQEIEKRTRNMEEYGEQKLIAYDSFTVTDHKGRGFIYRVKLDGYMHGVVLEKIDKAKQNAALQRATKGGKNGKSAANIKRRIRIAQSGMGGYPDGNGWNRASDGNPGYGRLGSGSSRVNNAGNDSGRKPSNRKVPDVTFGSDFLADDKLKGNYTVSEISEMFDAWNSDSELIDLSKMVFAKLQEIMDGQKKAYWATPYPIRFKSDAYLQKEYYVAPNGTFEPSRTDGNYGITYNLDYFRKVSDQEKARVLLHEAIHACTVSAIKSAERRIPKQADPMMINSLDGWSEEQKAGLELIQVFSQVRVANERNEYGQKNVYEMVAEMSNPEFRSMLKKERLWGRIVDAIKRLFGIEPKTAYDAVSSALEKILELDAPKTAGEVYSSQETDLDNAPTFYSQMGKVVEGMKQEKFGASSVISMLRGRGVKAEEIRWSGIQAFLDGKKSVTKKELLDFINSSMLHIEEEELGGVDKQQLWDDFYRQMESVIPYFHQEEIEEMCFDYDGEFSAEKFESELREYVEDGTISEDDFDEAMEYAEEMGKDLKTGSTQWSKYKLDGGYNYRELLFKMPGTTYTNKAMQAHWGNDAKSVLAHARIQDFNTLIGRMLFIEEIQSDWHNEGHKGGYLTKEESTFDGQAISKKLHMMEREMDEYLQSDSAHDLVASVMHYYDLDDEYRAIGKLLTSGEHDFVRLGRSLPASVVNGSTYKAMQEYLHERDRLIDEADRIYDITKGKAPDAPFKDNYHEYVLKRLIRMAAEEGYDSIGWTTADIQSKRWSKEYAEGYRIEYDQDIPKFLKKYGKQWGADVSTTKLNDDGSLPGYDGDPNAKKFDSPNEAVAFLESLGFTVRSTENKAYGRVYNTYSIFNPYGNYGTNYGVKQKEMMDYASDIRKEGIHKKGVHDVWSMNITPAMKQSVLKEGQAMYSSQETDADYMAALDKGDIVTAQRLVDKAASAAGYTQKGYHGTGEDFNIFSEEKIGGRNVWGKGHYFGTGKGIAHDYATWRESKGGKYRIISASLKMEKPYIPRKSSIGSAQEILDKWFPDMWKDSRDLGLGYIQGKLENDPHDLLQFIADHNKMEIRDVLTSYGYDSIKDGGELVVFSPTQIKSNEPVVWDDNGKVIPLSERFKKDNDDIRYSEHDTDYSNRSLLANAFEGITKSSIEYEMIQEYKDRIKLLNEQEEKLAKLNAEIREIRFTKGKYDAKKLKELEDEAKNVAKNINRHDKKLLALEASEPLRKVIERERKKEAQKTKEHVREIQQNKKVRADQAELRHKIRKAVRDLDKILNRGNKKSNVKEDMKGFVSKALELADYLFTDHISNDELIRRGITVRMTKREAALVAETEEILSKLYDNADNLTNEEFTKLDAKRKSNMEKLRDLLTAQRNERLNTPVYNLFNDLVTEYASLKNSKQDAVKAAYDPNVERFLRSYIGESNGETDSDRKTLLQNMRVADMTTDELWKLHNAYKMVLTSVRDANKLWVKGKAESVEQMANRIAGDFSGRKIPEGKLAIVARNIANKIGWDYEKLHYALDRIGSEAFTELVMNIADSENIVMQDVMEAAAFRDEMVKNYGFNNWDVNKEIDREFLDSTGKKFKLTLGQLMALYAYSRREGAWDHIEYGGFVFGEAALTNPKPADSYKLSKAQCEAITDLLTKDQKAYVEAMQKFLSETMGEKGNEVSMLLYGIKMFGEKNYFPIKIAGQFKAQAQESQAKAAAGFSSMTNAGFTHEQNPNAKAPFVLEGFNDIWADHVNEMSRYHGTVPALEDMRRVMNRSFYSDSGMESMAIKQLMENSFGKDAVEYFDNLYKEANSGAIRDKLQHKSNKLLSLFRKNSVAYSLSVLVQQPAAMVRAYAMIDRKYFGFKGVGALPSGIVKAVSDKWTKAHTNAYNEMLKYAPGVTMAKEIGGFDTHTGGSIRSYLLDTGKSLKQKWKTGTVAEKGKAVMDLVDDNAIANLPNLADKIAWVEIWNACKRETIAKHKDLVPTSDEFLQIVGDRFTEVIRATQVYDSMFSKSPMLKSKNLAVQYLVSFMNEPNTVANMVEKAVRNATKGDWLSGARTAHVVIHSIIFTNVLKSIVYAMRDDDEDETYIEKCIEAVAGNMMSDFNPLNYIPLVRDAWSLAQGYEVERADMAIVADALDALNSVIKNATTETDGMTEDELIEFDKKVTEANWKLVESVASFFGIPVKNIRREIEGVIDHARIAHANAGKTTAKSAWDKVYESVINSIPFMSAPSKQDKLYNAIIGGDEAYVGRLKNTYKTDSAYHSAVRKALRENDLRIQEAAQARYDGRTEEYKRIFREIQKEGKFTFDDIMSAINSEMSKLDPDKVTSAYTASGYVESIILGDSKSAQVMKADIIATKVANGKTPADAEKEFASSVATGIRDAYSSGLLNEAGAKKMLTEYADKDEKEAASKVSYWAFCEEHPGYDLTESNVSDYHEFAEPAEIPLDVYAQFVEGTKGLSTKKDEWGDVEVTKREQVLEVIDSLPLTWQQKDALYLAAGYSENQIWDVPW
jgi:hypothetical protein